MSSSTIQESRPLSQLSSSSSADLFRRCASGTCDLAWGEFVERFHGRLVMAVRRALLRAGRLAANVQRVEDFVQEIYCRLLINGRRQRCFHGSSEAQLMTYLQRVAVSVVVDALREDQAEKRRGGYRVAWADWRQTPALDVVMESGPEDRLIEGERRRAFLAICHRALGRRADAMAVKIARLALLEGWTSREIVAAIEGQLSIAGVDSVIHRLRRTLADRGIALPRRERLPAN